MYVWMNSRPSLDRLTLAHPVFRSAKQAPAIVLSGESVDASTYLEERIAKITGHVVFFSNGTLDMQLSNDATLYFNSITGLVRGVSFIFFLFITSYYAAIFFVWPLYAVFYFNSRYRRNLIDSITSSWLKLPMGIIENFYGVKLVFSGDHVDRFESSYAISNHRTRLDWMFLWGWYDRYGCVDHLKIALKSPLRWVFGFGWAIQALCYLFLQRNWEQDKVHIAGWIKYMKQTNPGLQFLFFPEGTDFTKNTKLRSDAFADKMKIQRLEYVLYPRKTGFVFILNQMRESLNAVHDFTIGYPSGVSEGELDVIFGHFPKEIHVNIKRYPIEEIPTDEEELGTWITDLWLAKEEKLHQFYLNAKLALDENRPLETFNDPYEKDYEYSDSHKRFHLSIKRYEFIKSLFYCLLWLGFTISITYGIFTYKYFRLYFIFSNALYLSLMCIDRGVDQIEFTHFVK